MFHILEITVVRSFLFHYEVKLPMFKHFFLLNQLKSEIECRYTNKANNIVRSQFIFLLVKKVIYVQIVNSVFFDPCLFSVIGFVNVSILTSSIDNLAVHKNRIGGRIEVLNIRFFRVNVVFNARHQLVSQNSNDNQFCVSSLEFHHQKPCS